MATTEELGATARRDLWWALPGALVGAVVMYIAHRGLIDDAYITLKLASADARYALSHLQGLGLHISDGDRKRVEASLTAVPPGVSDLVRDLLNRDQLAGEIVPITEQELKGLATSLDAIPASTWVTELEPSIGPRPALRAPDGRFYSPVDRKFYEKEEDLPAR